MVSTGVKPQDRSCYVLHAWALILVRILGTGEGSQGGIPFEEQKKLMKSHGRYGTQYLVFALGRCARFWALSVVVFGEFLLFLGIVHRLPQLAREMFESTLSGFNEKGTRQRKRTISNSSWHSLRCEMTMPCPSGIVPSTPTNLPSLRMESI